MAHTEKGRETNSSEELKAIIEGLKLVNNQSSALSELNDRLIYVLLDECDSFLEQGWLITEGKNDEPSETTAWNCYNEVLKLAPKDTSASARAKKGILDIKKKYITLGKQAYDKKDDVQLNLFIERLESIDPEYPE